MARKIRRLQRRARKVLERRRVAALIAEGCDDWDRDVVDSQMGEFMEDWAYDRAVSEMSLFGASSHYDCTMSAPVRDTSWIGSDLDDVDEETDKGSCYDDDDPINDPYRLAGFDYDDYDRDLD